ncbi:hypothetical protein FACS189430_04030 [Bacteroidia bacterium]|nr:hypothetical protein FACS189430_04030 [Bacteroidia bacterium]
MSIFLINLLFFSGNIGAEKYVDAYISDSKAIELDMENDMGDSVFEYSTIYTGLGTAFGRGKLTGTHVYHYIFYDTKYEKYFSLSIIPEKSLQFIVYYKLAKRTTIIAQVSNYEITNASYGTRDNPIHIFMPELPGETHSDFLERVITKDQYRRTVSFYLNYMMPKKEFKLFKNGVSINNKRK